MSIGIVLKDNQNNVSILFGEKFDLLIDDVKKADFKNGLTVLVTD